MKILYQLVRLSLCALCVLSISSASRFSEKSTNNKNFTSIEELTSSNKLGVRIEGIGGYQGNCIEFNLDNKTRDTLLILIEAGRRLPSFDTGLQDILIVKNQHITLAPSESKVISGYGFCCQSSNGCPREGSKFGLGNLAPSEWLALTKVIDENDFPSSAVQSAVWALSNDHSVSSIYSNDIDAVALLRETVAEIKGVEVPWYSIIYEKDSSLVFSNRPERIVAKVPYFLKNNSRVSIVLRDSNGRLVKNLITEIAMSSGKNHYYLNEEIKNWPKGEYHLYIYEDQSNVNQLKKIVI